MGQEAGFIATHVKGPNTKHFIFVNNGKCLGFELLSSPGYRLFGERLQRNGLENPEKEPKPRYHTWRWQVFQVEDVPQAWSLAIEAKDGGVFPKHETKPAVNDAAATKQPKFYPADDVKQPLVNKRKHKPTKLRYIKIFLFSLFLGSIFFFL